jgi:hypothetical protein
MKLDAFITDNEDNKLYDVVYYHNPARWQDNALSVDSSLLNEENWSGLIKYMNGNELSEEIKSLPNDKGGIYMFVIQGQTLPFVEYYLAYIGRAQFTDNQNIKKRAKEYFTEYYRKDKRHKIYRLFDKWKDFLYYRYYPETDNSAIIQNEAQLIRAILPPFNDEIPNKIDFKQPENAF